MMSPEESYEEERVETPLERAAREEGRQQEAEATGAAEAARDEREADAVISDIDSYVASTDPASLPEAEAALEAWQIPADPLEGVPDDTVVAPNVEGEPLVAVFAAQTESEANIIRGLLEAEGIPATFDGLPSPSLGNVLSAGETRWGDVLVAPNQAEEARAAIAAARQAAAGAEDEPPTP